MPPNEPPPPAERLSRDALRSRRARAVRAKTISIKRMTKRDLENGRLLFPAGEDDGSIPRPKTRGDCSGVPRPCPFVSCSHHVYLDVSPRTGAVKLNFPDIEPDELPPHRSCALDVADEGGITLEMLADVMNLTRERIRQIEVKALAKMQAAREVDALRDLADMPPPKRRLPLFEGE